MFPFVLDKSWSCPDIISGFMVEIGNASKDGTVNVLCHGYPSRLDTGNGGEVYYMLGDPKGYTFGRDSLSVQGNGRVWRYYSRPRPENFSKESSMAPVFDCKDYPNGCVCKLCNMTNEYAVPNQKDATYVCYNCK